MAYVYMQQTNGSGELHIFKASKNNDTNKWVKESDSLCSAIKWVDTGDVKYSSGTQAGVRTLSADLQNKGTGDICGNCIRHFYK